MWFLCLWAAHQLVHDMCVCVCVCVSPHKHTCMLERWRGCFRSRVNGFQVESVTTVIDLSHITTKLTILEYNFACPQGIPQWSAVKESTWNAGDAGLIPGLGRSPGEGDGNSLQYSWPGKSHEQRSLVGYRPWGRRELDTTEWLNNKSRYQCDRAPQPGVSAVSWIRGDQSSL